MTVRADRTHFGDWIDLVLTSDSRNWRKVMNMDELSADRTIRSLKIKVANAAVVAVMNQTSQPCQRTSFIGIDQDALSSALNKLIHFIWKSGFTGRNSTACCALGQLDAPVRPGLCRRCEPEFRAKGEVGLFGLVVLSGSS